MTSIDDSVQSFDLPSGSTLSFARYQGMLCMRLIQDGDPSPWCEVPPDYEDTFEAIWAGEGADDLHLQGKQDVGNVVLSVRRGELVDGQVLPRPDGTLFGFAIQINERGGWGVTMDRETTAHDMYLSFKRGDAALKVLDSFRRRRRSR